MRCAVETFRHREIVRALVIAAVATTLSSVATGCAGTQTARERYDKPRVGLVIINQEAAFFREILRGAQASAKREGVDLVVSNGNNDSAQQATAVENYAQQQIDAVIVNPVDAEAAKPSFAIAKDAGLGVITVDAALESPDVDTQVGTDNEGAGRKMGEFVARYAQENGKLSLGEVAALNSSVQIDRQRGFDPVFERGGNRIVQVVDGQNVQETALRAAEDLITGQGEKMNAIYATGEPALLGSVAAARSQRATDRLAIFGWDLTPEAIRGVQDGFVKGVVQQDPYTEGVRAVQSAAAIARGETPRQRIDVPITIVTKRNLHEFKEAFG